MSTLFETRPSPSLPGPIKNKSIIIGPMNRCQKSRGVGGQVQTMGRRLIIKCDLDIRPILKSTRRFDRRRTLNLKHTIVGGWSGSSIKWLVESVKFRTISMARKIDPAQVKAHQLTIKWLEKFFKFLHSYLHSCCVMSHLNKKAVATIFSPITLHFNNTSDVPRNSTFFCQTKDNAFSESSHNYGLSFFNCIPSYLTLFGDAILNRPTHQ